jgi:hypothetical protein
MYSNAFEMTQGHQHLYHCVQPLEAGHVMFRLDDVTGKERNRNNFNVMDKRDYSKEGEEEKIIPLWSWFFASFLMVLAITIGYGVVFGLYQNQTAFNDVYLTQFHRDTNSNEYSIAHAGRINPLVCIIIAISCACSSILVGWQNEYVFGQVLAFLLLVLTWVLQLASIILHIIKLFGNNGTSENTVMLTLHSTFGLHLATTVISLVVITIFAFLPHDGKTYTFQTWSTFWLTVVEDLNTIVCYVFIVCACNAQSGVHDDTSTFFDVVCVVMIGFLQHIANILMIFHGHVQLENDQQVKDNKAKISDGGKANPITSHSEIQKIINVIARTRLLIFFMIGILVVFFYLRITPTYEEFSLGIPYEIFRVLAIITMVSLNTLHSMWYELSNAYGHQKSWQSSPQWKIVTNLFIALVFSALVWRNVVQSNNEMDKKYLDNLIN